MLCGVPWVPQSVMNLAQGFALWECGPCGPVWGQARVGSSVLHGPELASQLEFQLRRVLECQLSWVEPLRGRMGGAHVLGMLHPSRGLKKTSLQVSKRGPCHS